MTEKMEATIGGGQPQDVLEQLASGEVAEAEKAVRESGMDTEAKEEALQKLKAGMTTPAQAVELARMYPPKSAKSAKRFRQV